MTIKNYNAFKFKENGLTGFEGNELDFDWDRNIRIMAYQTILKEKHSPSNPSLRIILEDSVKNHLIRYDYFFDKEGNLIKAFSSGINGDTYKVFPHKEQSDLDYLVLHGSSIQNILMDQEIPKELEDYQIIRALKDNSVEESYGKSKPEHF